MKSEISNFKLSRKEKFCNFKKEISYKDNPLLPIPSPWASLLLQMCLDTYTSQQVVYACSKQASLFILLFTPSTILASGRSRGRQYWGMRRGESPIFSTLQGSLCKREKQRQPRAAHWEDSPRVFRDDVGRECSSPSKTPP